MIHWGWLRTGCIYFIPKQNTWFDSPTPTKQVYLQQKYTCLKVGRLTWTKNSSSYFNAEFLWCNKIIQNESTARGTDQWISPPPSHCYNDSWRWNIPKNACFGQGHPRSQCGYLWVVEIPGCFSNKKKSKNFPTPWFWSHPLVHCASSGFSSNLTLVTDSNKEGAMDFFNTCGQTSCYG